VHLHVDRHGFFVWQNNPRHRERRSRVAIHKFLQRSDPVLLAPSALGCHVVLRTPRSDPETTKNAQMLLISGKSTILYEMSKY
jgi:hypothetical protein